MSDRAWKWFFRVAALLAVIFLLTSIVLAITDSDADASAKRWKDPVSFKSTVTPTQVWVDPQDSATAKLMGEATWWSAAFWNNYTVTKFNCLSALTGGKKPKLHCASAPCPTASYCLRIKYGDLPAGQVSKYEDAYCAGGCTRAGLITIDPNEVPYGGIHPWGTEERAMVIQHQIGRFMGLPANPVCTSVMYPNFICSGGGKTPHTLTADEAAYAGAW